MPQALDDIFSAMDAAAQPVRDPDASPTAVGPPAAAANTDIFAAMDSAHATIARGHVLAHADANPDAAAKALRVSEQIGVAQPAVENDLAGFTQQANAVQNMAIVDANPAVAKFVSNNPIAARIANDDFQNLGVVAQAIASAKSGFNDAYTNDELARLQYGEMVDGATSDSTARQEQLKSLLQGHQVSGAFNRIVSGFSGFLGGLADMSTRSAPVAGAGAVIGAGLGAPVGGVGAVPGAAGGATAGYLAGMVKEGFQTGAGQLYAALKDMRDSEGNPLSTGAVHAAALTGGLVLGLLNAVSADTIGGIANKTVPKFVSDAIASKLATEPALIATGNGSNTLAQMALGTAGSAAKGAAFGAVSQTASSVSEGLAKTWGNVVDGQHWDTLFNDPRELGRFASDVANSAAEMALNFGILHAGPGIVSLGADALHARNAVPESRFVDGLSAASEASRLRERAPEAFRQFVADQTDGTPIENLYVPADKLLELYQSKGVDPADRANDTILPFVKDLPQQLDDAHQVGGAVAISTADYAAHIAGTDIDKALRPDLRLGADAMSPNEAMTFAQSARDELSSDAKAATPVDTDQSRQVFEDVHQQVKGAGYAADVATAYSRLYAARYATRADRMGTDAMSEYQRSFDTSKPWIESLGTRGADGMHQDERGSIKFADGKALMQLFKDRDLSTLLHESGHLWFEEMRADAARPEAPDQLKADLHSVMAWLGVNHPDEIGTAHHEQFARAAEAYLREGKAPSTQLAGAFRRFKAWLTAIYRSVANLNTPINPEIKGVFDRLIASDSDIDAARHATRTGGLFRNAEQAGLSNAEFADYQRSIERSRSEAHEQLLAKNLNRVRTERSTQFKAEKARVTADVAQEVDKRPDVQALEYLRTGKMPENMPDVPKMKLDKHELVLQHVGEGILEDLPKGTFGPDGAHPDEIAEMFGFQSGTALVRALAELEDQRKGSVLADGKNVSIRDMLIRQDVQDRMQASGHDALMSDESMRDEALSAVHSAESARTLAIELRALGRQTGREGLPANVSREWADSYMEKQQLGELSNPDRYARNAARFGRDAERALLKGNAEEAYLYKRRQATNQALYMAARDAGAEIESGSKLMRDTAAKPTIASVAQDYVDQLHALLARFGFDLSRTDDELSRGLKGIGLSEFIDRKYADGYEPIASDFVVDPTKGGTLKTMTLGQFRELDQAVRSLLHVGREEQTVMSDGKRVDKQAAVAEIVARLGELKQRPKSDYFEPGDAGKVASKKDQLLSGLRSLNVAALKAETMFDWIDGKDANGPMNRLVFRRLKDAQHFENDKRTEIVGRFKELMGQLPKDWQKSLDRVIPDDSLVNRDTGNGFKVTRKRMLSIMLNMGNADNFTKLTEGYGWQPHSVETFVRRHATHADWDYAQGMWDAFEHLRPDIDALQRRVSGVGLDLVKATPIDTEFGTYRGGYFPLVYDPRRSPSADRHASKASLDMLENNYYRATTPKGHTISRISGVKQAVSTNLDLIPWKLGQAIHDLAFREAIMDADKILSDKDVKAAINGSLGHEFTTAMRPWLQSIANERNVNDASMQFVDRFLRGARTNLTMVGIGFRLSTMLKHGTTALSNSLGELGPKWMLAGSREYFGTSEQMRRSYEMVTEKSGEMRHRMEAIDRDLRENLATMMGQANVRTTLQRYGHYGVGFLDMMSAMPTWIGSYRKALSEGASEADAVYAADKTVRNAHGASGVTDMSALQRGSEGRKLFTMFYSFFNHIYNRQADTVRTASLGIDKLKGGDIKGASGDFGLVLARTITYLVVPAIVEAMVSKGGPNDDKDEGYGAWFGKALLAEIPAGIPVVRDLAKAAIEGRAYEMSPIARAADTIFGTLKDASHSAQDDGHASKRWLQHAAETAGYVTGYPTGQAGATAQYLWDYNSGDVDPRSASDWLTGLTTGHEAKP